MRKMKDSGIEWIGEIPEEWKALSAKYMVNISNGRDPVKEGNIPVYGSGANSYKTCGEYKEGPAVLVGRKGTIEIPRYIESKYWNIDTAFDVHAYKHGISLKYYYYLAVCFDYKFYLTQTALPSMTQTDYGNMVIPAPDNSDSIAEYLDSKCSKIDGLVSDIEKQIATLEQYKRSVITEAVTKGLDPAVPMKDSGIEWIGEIPEEWNPIRLKYIANYNTTTLTENTNADYEFDYIDIGSVTYGKGIEQFQPMKFSDAPSRARRVVKPHDVIVSTVRTYLKAIAYVPEYDRPVVVSTGFLTLTAKPIILPKFLRYAVESEPFVSGIEANSVGISYPAINTSEAIKVTIILPPLSEQHTIADYLDSKCSEIDSAISLKKQQIETLNDYKKSLIYEYVTGKKEIPA